MIKISSFKHAARGIYLLIKTQRNGRFHFLAAVMAIFLGVYTELSLPEWCLVILCIGMVISLEGMNTGLEFLTDLVSPEYHKLAGNAKDVAAGAVLVGSVAALVIGFLLFVPKLVHL